MNSPLQLKHHVLQEIHIKECEKCENAHGKTWVPDEPVIKGDIAFVKDDGYKSRIILTINSRKSKGEDEISAWSFGIKLSGFFDFEDKEYDIEKAQKLSFVNGCSLLYGVARDILYSLSLRGRKPPILLPSINFQPALKDLEKKKAVLEHSDSKERNQSKKK